MTPDQTEPVEPGDAPQTEQNDEQADEQNDSTVGNAEAAKWRRKLRDTEAERDSLAARLAGMQRAEIERVAGQKLAVGGDLFAVTGLDVADFVGDEGQVVPELVLTAAEGLLADRPGLARRTWPAMGQDRVPAFVRTEGPTWSEVLNPPQ